MSKLAKEQFDPETSNGRAAYRPVDRPDLFKAFPATTDVYRTTFPAYWSPYKTADEKLEYQRRLPSEIQPYIRTYLEGLRPEIDALQSNQRIESYLPNTRRAWERHIAVNRLVDCFLTYELNHVFGDWSVAEWRLARRLLVAAMITDREKALYSAGIKGVLDREAQAVVEKYRGIISSIEQWAYAPSLVTFYEAYDFAHKKYLLSVVRGTPDDRLRREIVHRYHADDERVFERRLQKLRATVKLEALADELNAAERMFRERSTAKRYLMLERPDLAALDDLLSFDNTIEYEYTYSLKGFPDLFLREEILRRLKEADLIAKDVSVFGLSLEDFVRAVDQEIVRLERHFTIRLRPYRQTYDTCGVACVMSLLNRKGSPLNEETELKLWELVGKPFNFPGGLAWILLRSGFQVTYRQDRAELLRADNPEFVSMDQSLLSAAECYVDLHRQAIAEGLHFEVADWDFGTVLSEVTRGNTCLLYLHVTSTISHVVIARGVRNGRLEIIDPLGHLRFLDESELNRRIMHPMGKRMLVVKKLPVDFFFTLEKELDQLHF